MSDVDVQDLKDLIQEKKESKDSYTIQQGLISEQDCFEAIEALGQRLYVLQDAIKKKLDMKCDMTDPELQALLIAAQKVQQLQHTVVNDVCSRFEVIHPEHINVDSELYHFKQKYWDWYRDQYKKYYGRPAPEVIAS